MHPSSSLPHFRGLSLWSSQTQLSPIPDFFFWPIISQETQNHASFFFFYPLTSCNLFLALPKLMVSKIMHNVKTYITEGWGDGIKWTGRPGPGEDLWPCFHSLPAEGAFVLWLCPVGSSLQSNRSTAQAAQWVGPSLPLGFQTMASLLWGNKLTAGFSFRKQTIIRYTHLVKFTLCPSYAWCPSFG